jgi:hypothetical protein
MACWKPRWPAGAPVPEGPLPPDPTRRVVLGAAAAGTALLLAGCRGIQVLGSPPAAPADVTALQGAIAAERLMVERYQAALRLSGNGLAGPVLGQLLSQHRAHLAKLEARLIRPAGLKQSAAQPAAGQSGTAGSGTAGSGPAGSGPAGSGTAGSSRAGSSPAGSGTAGSSPAGSSTGQADAGLPADPAQALQFLADAEQAAATRLGRELLTAPPSLAQLLASIAAAEATHVLVLRAAGRPG